MPEALPILYSFRRCPYAMRARLAIVYSGIQVELREIVLKHKPQVLIDISPKATVPVLQLPDGNIIDESYDIMLWALQQNDSHYWLKTAHHALIDENDYDFKPNLDRYKYADRFPERTQGDYRALCIPFLEKIEGLLAKHAYIQDDTLSCVDIAIFPFVRQFYVVDKLWFEHAPFPHLYAWLSQLCHTDLFTQSMQKYPAWQMGDKQVIFP